MADYEFRCQIPLVIGVAGRTAAGKSTVCQKIMEKVGKLSDHRRPCKVAFISQDSFYRELTDEEKAKALKGEYSFDHPAAFDNELMLKILKDILSRKVVSLPVYDFKTNSRKKDEFVTVYPADVVLFEGMLVFHFPEIRELFHIKLFVDIDLDRRLARRVLQDTKSGRDLEQIMTYHLTHAKPAFEEFYRPTRKYADVIIPRGEDNEVAIDLFVSSIQKYPCPTLSMMQDSSENITDHAVTYCL